MFGICLDVSNRKIICASTIYIEILEELTKGSDYCEVYKDLSKQELHNTVLNLTDFYDEFEVIHIDSSSKEKWH